MVKAGSRQENLNNSSVANFAAYGALNGTAKYSKNKIDELVDSFGGQISVKVEREITQFTLSFEPQFLAQAVELLSQIVLQPTYEATEHEALKVGVHARASPMDPYTISTESVHYTAYRVQSSSCRIILWDSLPKVLEMLSSLSPPTKSNSITTTSMSAGTSLSAEPVTLMGRPCSTKSAITLARSPPSESVKFPTVTNLFSHPLCSTSVTTRCLTLASQLPSKPPAGTIPTSSP